MYWIDRRLIDFLSGLIVEYDGWSVVGDYAVKNPGDRIVSSSTGVRGLWFGGLLNDPKATAKERGNWFDG